MKHHTTEIILKFLRTHPPTTASELSSALLLTKAAIRFQLNKLLGMGLIKKQVKHLAPGAGRPVYYFTPNTKSSYKLLSEMLMNQLFSNTTKDDIIGIVDKLSSSMLIKFDGLEAPGAQRIGLAMQHLTDLEYQASWEARPDHPLVYLKNCPYVELAKQYQELCLMDTLLIEKLTGWKCTNLQRTRDDLRKIPFCLFSLISP